MANEKTQPAPQQGSGDMFGDGPAANADQIINDISAQNDTSETGETITVPLDTMPKDVAKGDVYVVSDVTDKDVTLAKEIQNQ